MPWEPLPGSADPAPETIGAGLDRLLRNLGAPKAATVGDLFERWPDLVGEGIAARVRPTALRDGTLLLAVEDPAWATQVRFLEADLLARLAEGLGEGTVNAIDVRVRRG